MKYFSWLSDKQPSLQRYLLRWAMGVVLMVWFILLAVAWGTGLRESREFADGHLVSVAHMLLQTGPGRELELKPGALDGVRHEYLMDVAVMEWQDQQMVLDNKNLAANLEIVGVPKDGFATVVYRSESQVSKRRLYSAAIEQEGHQRRVAVSVSVDRSGEMARDIAEHVAQPAVVVFPLVALLMWWAIRRGLRPLVQLSDEVAELDGFAGQRMDVEHRFLEFNSTLVAINTLIDRLQQQVERERAFASDVAHELRTPLAAMALQASAAQTEPTPERLNRLSKESLRAGRILAQLLDLARAQRVGSSHAQGDCSLVDVGEIALKLVADHAQKAYEMDHELSLSQPDTSVKLGVQPLLLELALRNLIDNALQHTPRHTQVSVEIEQAGGEVRVSVSDDGLKRPGVEAAADRGGMGLGLRLVKRIAEEMGATLTRDEGATHMGTRFTLLWAPAEVPAKKEK